MIYINIILGGVVLLLLARVWAMHTAITGIIENFEGQIGVNDGFSKRISAAHDYHKVHHDNWTKLAGLVADQSKGDFVTFEEIKKLKHNLGCTNTRVHILETGLEKMIPILKQRLIEIETKQDPLRYFDEDCDPDKTQINYGGTD